MQDLRNSLPDDYPITGLCISRDLNRCPNGYKPIDKTQDRNDDADLWKDSMFGKRNTRYICITRIFPLANGTLNNVLVDVAITNTSDPIPPGFTHVETTIDTNEKAIKKKNFCVKMINRTSTASAITELILLSKAKRAPSGYTIVGDINSILLCYKMGPVPQDTRTQPASSPLPYALHPSSPNGGQPPVMFGTGAGYHNSTSTPPSQPHGGYLNSPLPHSTPMYQPTYERSQGQGDTSRYGVPANTQPASPAPAKVEHPLSGVPFRLHSRFQVGGQSDNYSIPDVLIKSRHQVFQEFSYPFTIERTAAARIPPELE